MGRRRPWDHGTDLINKACLCYGAGTGGAGTSEMPILRKVVTVASYEVGLKRSGMLYKNLTFP